MPIMFWHFFKLMFCLHGLLLAKQIEAAVNSDWALEPPDEEGKCYFHHYTSPLVWAEIHGIVPDSSQPHSCSPENLWTLPSGYTNEWSLPPLHTLHSLVVLFVVTLTARIKAPFPKGGSLLFAKGCLGHLEYKEKQTQYIPIDCIGMQCVHSINGLTCRQYWLGFLKLVRMLCVSGENREGLLSWTFEMKPGCLSDYLVFVVLQAR